MDSLSQYKHIWMLCSLEDHLSRFLSLKLILIHSICGCWKLNILLMIGLLVSAFGKDNYPCWIFAVYWAYTTSQWPSSFLLSNKIDEYDCSMYNPDNKDIKQIPRYYHWLGVAWSVSVIQNFKSRISFASCLEILMSCRIGWNIGDEYFWSPSLIYISGCKFVHMAISKYNLYVILIFMYD